MRTYESKQQAGYEEEAETDVQQPLSGKSSDIIMTGRATPFMMKGRAGDFSTVESEKVKYSADDSAIAEHVHEGLAANKKEEVFAALQRLNRSVKRIANFRAAYVKKYSSDAETDIRAKLTGGPLDFALELIGVVPGTSVIPEEVPRKSEEYDAMAGHLYNALAASPPDAQRIYGILTKIKLWKRKTEKLFEAYRKLYTSKLSGKGFEADLEQVLKGDELFYALYILHAPGAESPPSVNASTISNVTPGADKKTGSVIGGKVTGSADTSYDQPDGRKVEDNFSFGYEGALSGDTRWMQFVWSELIVDEPEMGTFNAGGSYHSSNDKKKEKSYLTVDPSKPFYDVDSSPGTPFYEDFGINERTYNSTTMIDKPEFDSFVKSAFKDSYPAATKMVAVKHFDAYLIRDFYVLHHYEVEVKWTYNSATDTPPRVQSVKKSEAFDHLPAEMKNVMVAKYPQYKYIRSA